MFSLENFYYILNSNLVSKFNTSRSYYFYPFGTFDVLAPIVNKDIMSPDFTPTNKQFFYCYFFDQEPYYEDNLSIIKKSFVHPDYIELSRKIYILANSEKSQEKDNFIKSNKLYDWYYFYHGFAALDWYRDFQYVSPTVFDNFTKVFISYNHLMSKYRSYRLHLVSNLIEKDLVKFGAVSLFLKDNLGTWEETIRDQETPLDSRARIKIYKALKGLTAPLTIDTDSPSGAMSAKVDLAQLTSALWHVVTETVYFFPKLHLTEKVFKPIIAQRPFILVASVGNLAYLKSYGFKTFDSWIDESYDLETDNYIRIEKITQEIERLCAMSPEQLKQMHQEMREVLKFNYDHFYGKFKNIITNELVDNFEGILTQINNGRMPNNHSRYHQRFELEPGYLNEVKQRLLK